LKKENNGSVKVIPIGGLEQIGMNMTVIESEDSIIVVDCGLAFPDDEMLGIDLVIPDIKYLKDNIHKMKGFVITHGHEDHIGAIPYVLKQINAPIYATKLTMGLIESKLKEHSLVRESKRKVIKYGQSINLGCFRIEFIRTNHSIADAAALATALATGAIGDYAYVTATSSYWYWNSALATPAWVNEKITVTDYNALTAAEKEGAPYIIMPAV
jgi:ribonuclease J